MCRNQNEHDKISKKGEEKVSSNRLSPGGLTITEGDFENRLNDYEEKCQQRKGTNAI